MTILDEKHILTEVATGNIKAFEQLFLHYQPKLVAFLTGLTHDKEVSRDMSQDLFFTLWNNRERLANVQSFSAYLYQMARFTAYDYFDRLEVADKYTNEFLLKNSFTQSDEEALFAKELQHLIDEAVERMPPQRKLVYVLSRKQGFSNEEIALQLGINKRTVENHLTTALTTLRKIIYLFILTQLK